MGQSGLLTQVIAGFGSHREWVPFASEHVIDQRRKEEKDMPRPPRDFKPGNKYYIKQRGNNGDVVFRDDDDRAIICKIDFPGIRMPGYTLLPSFTFTIIKDP